MADQKTGTGFVSLQDYLDANQGAVDNSAGQLTQAAGTQADEARANANSISDQGKNYTPDLYWNPQSLPDYAQGLSQLNDAASVVSGVGDQGNIAAGLQRQAASSGSPNYYTQGDNDLDTSLVQAGGQGAFKGLQAENSDLSGYLDQHAQQVHDQYIADAPPGTSAYPEKLKGRQNPSPVLSTPRSQEGAINTPTPGTVPDGDTGSRPTTVGAGANDGNDINSQSADPRKGKHPYPLAGMLQSPYGGLDSYLDEDKDAL